MGPRRLCWDRPVRLFIGDTPYLRRAGIPIAELVWSHFGVPEEYPVEPRQTLLDEEMAR